MKKKHLLFCVLVALCFAAITKIPIRPLFGMLDISGYSEMLNVTIKVCLIVITVFILVRKYELAHIGGFWQFNRKNYWILLLPLLYPGVWPLSVLSEDCFRNSQYLVTTLIILLVKGISEEIVFRGVIQGYLIKYSEEKSFHRIAIVTSIIFAIAHLANLVSKDIGYVFPQVIYAFFMGMLFSAILIKTNNVWLLGIIHGLLNFVFRLCSNRVYPGSGNEDTVTVIGFILNLAALALVFSPTLLIYWLLMRKIKITQ